MLRHCPNVVPVVSATCYGVRLQNNSVEGTYIYLIAYPEVAIGIFYFDSLADCWRRSSATTLELLTGSVLYINLLVVLSEV